MWEFVSKVRAQTGCVDPNSFGNDNIDLGEVLCLSNDTAVKEVYTSPAFLVNLIVRNIFVVGGVILFLLIFYAGFKFIQSGSQGKEEAKKIITTALIGAIVMFCAYWIVQIVAVVTGINIPVN